MTAKEMVRMGRPLSEVAYRVRKIISNPRQAPSYPILSLLRDGLFAKNRRTIAASVSQ